MQSKSYDKQRLVDFIKENAINDPKAKGKRPSSPDKDGIKTDIKSMSITTDVDGSVFAASFHEAPARFYSFVLPDELYNEFEHFKHNYNYNKTPKKKTLDRSKFDGLFEPAKTVKDLLKEVDTDD